MAAARSTPFTPGQTIDPGTDSQPCGPLDGNCFPVNATGLSTSSPVVGYITATSTTATSTFAGAISVNDIVAKGPIMDVRAYSSLASAVSAIGSTPTTLLIPNTQVVSLNLTIPSNITLQFSNGGMIHVSDNATTTIQGAIIAAPVKIFDNVAIGHGGISLYGNKYLQGAYLNWWGADNTGATDAQPIIQEAINGVSSNGHLYTNGFNTYLLNNTLHFDSMGDFWLEGVTPAFSSGNGTTFKWNGANGGIMATFYNLSTSHISGINWIASTSVAAAGIVWDIDRITGLGGNCTQDDFIDNSMVSNPASSTFEAIRLSHTSWQNCEFMHFVHNIVQGSNTYQGTGLDLGASSNAHGHVLDSNTFYSFNIGVYSGSSSFDFEGTNNFGNNNYDVWVDELSYPSVIQYMDSEGSKHLFYINGANAPLTVRYGRLVSPGQSGDGCIQFGAAAMNITFEGNVIDCNQSNYIYDASAAQNLKLTSSSNRYDNLNGKNVSSVYHGFWPSYGGAQLIANDRQFITTATSTNWSNTEYIISPIQTQTSGLTPGVIHFSPGSYGSGYPDTYVGAITMGATSPYSDKAEAGIYMSNKDYFGSSAGTLIHFDTTDDLSVGSKERMTLNEFGNLGIGTTSPSNKLEVAGNGYFAGNLTGANITATGTLSLSALTGTQCLHEISGVVSGTGSDCGSGGGGASSVGLSGLIQFASTTLGSFMSNSLFSISTSTYQLTANSFNAALTTGTSTFLGGLTVGNNAGFTLNSQAPAGSLFVAGNGNVGIGTTNPGTKLESDGTIRVTNTTNPSSGSGLELQKNAIWSYDRSGGSVQPLTIGASTLTISHTGVVEVGQMSSNGGIQVTGNTVPASGSGIEIQGGNNTKIIAFNRTASSYIPLEIDGSTLTLQNGAGNVGVNTATASSTLSVLGGFAVGDSSYTTGVLAPTYGAIIKGNVGIGSTSPSTKLVVAGTATVGNIVSTTTATSTFGGNISPSADNLYSLGAPGNRWSTIWSGTTNVGDLVFGNNFRILEASSTDSLQAMIWRNQNGKDILNLDENGNLNILGDICSNSATCFGQKLNTLSSNMDALANNTAENQALTFSGLSSKISALSLDIASTTSDLQNRVSNLESLSPTIASSTASTTAATLDASPTFIQSIASAVLDLLKLIGNLTLDSVTAVTGVFTHVQSDSIQSNIVESNAVKTNTLCADDVCINKDQLKALLIQAGGVSSSSPRVSDHVLTTFDTTLHPLASSTIYISTSTPAIATSSEQVASSTEPIILPIATSTSPTASTTISIASSTSPITAYTEISSSNTEPTVEQAIISSTSTSPSDVPAAPTQDLTEQVSTTTTP